MDGCCSEKPYNQVLNYESMVIVPVRVHSQPSLPATQPTLLLQVAGPPKPHGRKVPKRPAVKPVATPAVEAAIMPKRRRTSLSATVMAVTRPITRYRAWTLRWRQSQMISGSAQTALSNSEALVCILMLHVAMPQLRHGPIQQRLTHVRG